MDEDKLTSNFKLLSLNVRGLQNEVKRKSIFNWITAKRYDIVFLQETHSSQNMEVSWNRDWPGKITYSHGTSNSRGCMMMFRDTLDIEIQHYELDPNGRYMLVKCLIQDDNFTLLNVYLPNTETEQIEVLENISNLLIRQNITITSNLICGGDWNIVQNQEMDKFGGIHNPKHKSLEKLQDILNTYNLTDVWRMKNPNTVRYTWRQRNPIIQCRLDYWLISEKLVDDVAKSEIIPSVRSDHSAITLDIQTIKDTKRGSNHWKMNNSLLEKAEYVSMIEVGIQDWMKECEPIEDHRIKWEYVKYKIRDETIKFSKTLKNKERVMEKELQMELLKLDKNPTNPENLEKSETIKNKLKSIEDVKMKGLIVRSKVLWYEKGEKSSRYFFELEKHNAVKKHIRKLKTATGEMISNPVEIEK